MKKEMGWLEGATSTFLLEQILGVADAHRA